MQFKGILTSSNSTRDSIITILSEEWPLSTKEIHSRLKRQGKTISYQAVHKTLQELKQNKIVTTKMKKFLLNLEWIEGIKSISTQLENSYLNNKDKATEAETKNYTVSTAMELAEIVLDIFSYPNPKNKPSICHWWSIYPTFSLSELDYKQLTDLLAKTPYYILGHNATPVDEIFANNFRELGAKVVLGTDIPLNPDTIVCGDYVCHIWFQPSFRKKWLTYCKVGGVLNKLKMDKLLFLLYKHKDKFNVIITKNTDVADNIREQTLEHFKKSTT